MLDISNSRSLFPVTADWAYLNNAYRGPISLPAAAAAKAYIDSLCTRGVTAWADWERTWEDTHSEFAAFIGAARDEVQLLANATDALTRVTLGLDWQPGDHAIVYLRDYPGVVRPALDLARRGVQVTTLPEPENGQRSVQSFVDAITPRTRLVAASWVDFRSGFKLDVAGLARACRARGVFCAIDAVQAIGANAVDAHALGADALTFASRKYLNGLDSIGVLYIRADAIDKVAPHSRATYSVPRPFDFNAVEQPHADGARRYMLGAPAMPQVYALQAALKLQRETGPAAIHAATAKLAQETRERARAAGFATFGDDWPDESRSQIVSIRRQGKLASEDLADRLTAAKVAASARQGILRIAPHWYNTSADLQRLFAALE
ncbi:MAG: aminotransferase class V-fold PLP-dependent enzyme [Planctomycetes bacterium]|nr:aminotransferase class V-fold PLP-dependent enzyme [Planctomycetota bacterium]